MKHDLFILDKVQLNYIKYDDYLGNVTLTVHFVTNEEYSNVYRWFCLVAWRRRRLQRESSWLEAKELWLRRRRPDGRTLSSQSPSPRRADQPAPIRHLPLAERSAYSFTSYFSTYNFSIALFQSVTSSFRDSESCEFGGWRKHVNRDETATYFLRRFCGVK